MNPPKNLAKLKPLEKMTGEELEDHINYANYEIKEWNAFIKLLKNQQKINDK